jgi:hypothetical protein
MPTIPIGLFTYNAGPPIHLGPASFAQGSYWEATVTPGSDLLLGTTISLITEISSDGGSSWRTLGGNGGNNIVGPQVASDLVVALSLSVKNATTQARATFQVVSGSWSTAFTIVYNTRPEVSV